MIERLQNTCWVRCDKCRKRESRKAEGTAPDDARMKAFRLAKEDGWYFGDSYVWGISFKGSKIKQWVCPTCQKNENRKGKYRRDENGRIETG